MRFIHLSLVGYKCLFMNVNYKGQNLLFFLLSLRLTRDDCKRSMNVRIARPSVAYWKYCSRSEQANDSNEIKGSRSDFATRWQSLESSSVILGALETRSQRWRCLEWCFQNSFKENRYFLYFVLLSLRRWSLNMCVLVRAHTTWAASINQTDETIASTSQRLRSEENLNDKYSSM